MNSVFSVGRLKVSIRDKAITLRQPRDRVSCNLSNSVGEDGELFTHLAHTFDVIVIIPNALKVPYSSHSFSSKLPMKRFAPASSCFLSDDACVRYVIEWYKPPKQH
jgi:hypothetical protein